LTLARELGQLALSVQKPTIFGVDPESRRVAYAKRFNPGYEFKILKGINLPLANDSVNYILTLAVLYHIASDDLVPYLSK